MIDESDRFILQQVKQSANGMLPLEAYFALFEIARRRRGGVFVEVGTAHGAATIALALGARQSRRDFHIFTADPFSGTFSSRTAFGSIEDNIRFVDSQFRKFGVGEHITVVAGTSAELKSSFDLARIDVLLVDADGCIDRDIGAFFPRLAADADIVIDDIDDWIGMGTINGMTVLDQKHRLGFLITRELVAHDLLSPDRTINSTGFFKKGPAASDAERIALLSIPCYRQLVFARLEYTGDRSASPLKSWIAEKVPFSRPLYRKVKALSRGQWRRQSGRHGAGAGE